MQWIKHRTWQLRLIEIWLGTRSVLLCIELVVNIESDVFVGSCAPLTVSINCINCIPGTFIYKQSIIYLSIYPSERQVSFVTWYDCIYFMPLLHPWDCMFGLGVCNLSFQVAVLSACTDVIKARDTLQRVWVSIHMSSTSILRNIAEAWRSRWYSSGRCSQMCGM